LRARIIAWFLAPTALILALVALFTFYTCQRVTEALVVQRNRALNELMPNRLSPELRGYVQQLGAIGADSTLFEGDGLAEQAQLRLATARLMDFDGGVLLLSPTGVVAAADGRRQEALGEDGSARPIPASLLSSPRWPWR